MNFAFFPDCVEADQDSGLTCSDQIIDDFRDSLPILRKIRVDTIFPNDWQ
jgi:hypothetical protein